MWFVKTKMNPKDRAQRIVALEAIENQAQKLADSGADEIDVQGFISGARKELANQKPDKEAYFDAAVAAKKAKG